MADTQKTDSSTSYNDTVNTHVSTIDAAFPGVQPVSHACCHGNRVTHSIDFF